MGCAHVLGRDALEISAHFYVFAEVFERVYLPCRVDGNEFAGGMGNFDDLFESQYVRIGRVLFVDDVVNTCSTVGYCVPQIVLGRTIFVAEFDQFGSGQRSYQ